MLASRPWVQITALGAPVEQRHLTPVGDDQFAIAVADVGGQFGAAAGRIDPDDRRAGEGGGTDPEEVLGDVLEQHADVERAAVPMELASSDRTDRAGADDVIP